MKKLITISLLTAAALICSSCTINMKVTVEQIPSTSELPSDSTSVTNFWF